jgi:hypothetical protein
MISDCTKSFHELDFLCSGHHFSLNSFSIPPHGADGLYMHHIYSISFFGAHVRNLRNTLGTQGSMYGNLMGTYWEQQNPENSTPSPPKI